MGWLLRSLARPTDSLTFLRLTDPRMTLCLPQSLRFGREPDSVRLSVGWVWPAARLCVTADLMTPPVRPKYRKGLIWAPHDGSSGEIRIRGLGRAAQNGAKQMNTNHQASQGTALLASRASERSSHEAAPCARCRGCFLLHLARGNKPVESPPFALWVVSAAKADLRPGALPAWCMSKQTSHK